LVAGVSAAGVLTVEEVALYITPFNSPQYVHLPPEILVVITPAFVPLASITISFPIYSPTCPCLVSLPVNTAVPGFNS